MITIHCVTAGFTQNRSQMHGMLKLDEEVRKVVGNGIYTRVWFQRWDDNWEEIAEHAWLLGRHYDCPVQVVSYCYSWGCGWGFTQFAEYLRLADIDVAVAVLCDPVYRHKHWLFQWVTQWRAFISQIPIDIPTNVKEVYSFVQKQETLRGHDLRAPHLGPDKLHPPVELETTHNKMDDHPEFHKTCLEVAATFVRGGTCNAS